MRGDRGKDVPPMEGPADRGQVVLTVVQDHCLCQRVFPQHIRQQAVVRADIDKVADFCCDGPPGAADAGVYDSKVDRSRWEVSVGGLQDERARLDVLHWDMMCQVNDIGPRRERLDDTLHHTHESVLCTEVRQEGNNTH